MTGSIFAISLSAALGGCATAADPTTGQTKQELTPTGQVLVAVLVGSALLASAASMGATTASTAATS